MLDSDQNEVPEGPLFVGPIPAYGEKIGIPDPTSDPLIKSYEELFLADLKRRWARGSESKNPLYCVTSGRT